VQAAAVGGEWLAGRHVRARGHVRPNVGGVEKKKKWGGEINLKLWVEEEKKKKMASPVRKKKKRTNGKTHVAKNRGGDPRQ